MSNIMLNQNQQRVLEILVKTQAGQICKTRSSEILGVSVRQLNRKLKALREKGAASVIHGNTGKSNVGKLDQSISAEIVRLYTSEYRDWNFSHFRDVLVDKYHLDICLSSVRRILENHGNELRHEKISCPDKANIYIQDVFVPSFNDKFALPIKDEHNVFVPVETDFDCNCRLVIFEERMVQQHCFIAHHGQYLTIINPDTHQPVHFNTTKPVLVYTFLDNTIHVCYHHQFYPTKCISIKEIKALSDKKLIHTCLGKSHPVSPNHPWKRFRI